MRPGGGPFGRLGAAVLKKKARWRRGKILPAFSKAAGCGGSYVPVGRCPAANRAGRRDWRPTVFQPAQPVKKAAARPHAAKRIGRTVDLSHKTEKGHPREKLGCPFYLLVGESRSEPLSPLWGACGFRSWSFLTGCAARQGCETLSRALPAFFRESWAKNFPRLQRVFYYLHSLYTAAPWAGNVAASFPSTLPWSWWLHSSRAV